MVGHFAAPLARHNLVRCGARIERGSSDERLELRPPVGHIKRYTCNNKPGGIIRGIRPLKHDFSDWYTTSNALSKGMKFD